MHKQEADFLNKISVYWLNEYNYFDQSKKGGIEWTNQNNSISIETNMEKMFLKISYTLTDRFSGEKKEIDYKVPLTTTGCNYGGVRYWFKCPLVVNNKHCNKRVGCLYKGGDYFGCRDCYDLTYSSKNRSYRLTPAMKVIELSTKALKLSKKIKTKFYDGKPTKKFKKLLELNKKINSYNLSSTL